MTLNKQGKTLSARTLKVSLLGTVACLATALSIGSASAYVGDSFMQVPGVQDARRGPEYQRWVRFTGNYWKTAAMRGFNPRGQRSVLTLPLAPRIGAGTLIVSVDKRSPVLSKLMDACTKKSMIPAVTYAESADRSRSSTEVGPRPASVPEYFEYKLHDVTLSSCPVVAGAPDQAFVIDFKNIEWLNYKPTGTTVPTTPVAAVLPPAQTSGATKTFVLTWYGYAHDVSEDQCPKMAEKPSEASYYRYFTPEAAALERAKLTPKGGPSYADGQMCLRGPEQLNVCRLPGIVPDPGQPEPITKIARGLNLDGTADSGKSRIGEHKRNFVTADGLTGIDNQLYVAQGCFPGLRGHAGTLVEYANEQRKNGMLAMLVQITGIDNEKNDDSVDVTLLYSLDPTAKSGDGSKILSDYTFRVTNNLEYGETFKRWRARIVDGVIITEPTAPMDPLRLVIPLEVNTTLFNASMRLTIQPDGTLKGILGGYQDWRTIVNANNSSLQESLFGGAVEAMYNALRRNADGMWNPVAKEYMGISSAWDLQGVPAYIPASQQPSILAVNTVGAGSNGKPR